MINELEKQIDELKTQVLECPDALVMGVLISYIKKLEHKVIIEKEKQLHDK